VPEPGRLGDVLPVAPPSQIAMLTDYIKPEQTFVTCPNQDTVYGAGFQKLDTMSVVVQVPDFGDRFFTYQIVDHRTDSFASIGKQRTARRQWLDFSAQRRALGHGLSLSRGDGQVQYV
jgi:hypothetical protein